MVPFRSLAATAAVAFFGGLPAVAHGQLNIMCLASAEVCRQLADEFQKDTGIKAMLVPTPGGRAAFATLAEQKGRPQSDVWFGGSAEAHYRAAKFDLVDTYASPMVKELQPWAQKVAEQSKSQSFGIYARVIGIGYNSARATQKKLAAPACWKDLAKPGYAGEVHITDPNASGATYPAIAGMAQICGEDQALQYLKAMYKAPPPTKKGPGGNDAKASIPKGVSIPNSAKGSGAGGSGPGAAGASMVGKGRAGKGAASDTGVAVPPVGNAIAGIGFIGDIVAEADGGAPVKAVAPCEGTVYEVSAVSIVKGAKNLDNAKKFVDWALGAKAQALAVKGSRAYPANTAVASSPLAPKWSEIKFIDYDIAKYEKSAERRRLIGRWTGEIGAAAQ